MDDAFALSCLSKKVLQSKDTQRSSSEELVVRTSGGGKLLSSVRQTYRRLIRLSLTLILVLATTKGVYRLIL